MKNGLGRYGVLILVWSVAACDSTIKVTSDYDRSVNFYQYTTYMIASLDEKFSTVSRINANRIVAAIRSEMEKKNLEEDTVLPDLKVNVVTILTDKRHIISSEEYYNYGGLYRPYIWGSGINTAYTTFNVSEYTQGSLIIEMVDVKSNKLIWEGVGDKEIDLPVKNPDAEIQEAVSQILKDFPPHYGIKKKVDTRVVQFKMP